MASAIAGNDVTLTLDTQEAKFVWAVLQYVGGTPFNSSRKYAEQVISALENALLLPNGDTEIGHDEYEVEVDSFRIEGSLNCQEWHRN